MSAAVAGSGTGNKGWTMAKNLLGLERIGSGSPRQSSYALGRLRHPFPASGAYRIVVDVRWHEPDKKSGVPIDLGVSSETFVTVT